MLPKEGSQERQDNLAEIKQLVYEYETSCERYTKRQEFLIWIAELLFCNSKGNTAVVSISV
ncbi:MAG: hypothetical protein WC147_07470 [Syntrophomonas sp.]